MKNSRQIKQIVFGVLVAYISTALLITLLGLGACGPLTSFIEGEDNMSEEEIVKRNTEKLFEYYTNEELFVDGMQSQEGAARSAAKQLFKVSENLIVSVSSELYESGAVDLTVTDTKDKVMILHLSRWGSLDEITDEEGAVLFMKIM